MNAVLDAMAGSVRRADPRSKDARRSDAFFAVFAESPVVSVRTIRLPRRTCSPSPVPHPPRNAVVHLIADRAGTTALTGSLDRIDAEALAAAVEYATVREVEPGTVTVEQGRFPSAKLAEFIRCRDLTCQLPRLRRPGLGHRYRPHRGLARRSHPSVEPQCLCRTHHLLKNVLRSIWNDVQLANGTVVWTSPTGHVYTTEPEGAQWFAGLGDPTGEPTLQAIVPTLAKRCMKMPSP